MKKVIAVDSDVDIFDERSIMWALATRVQWDRDSMLMTGMIGSMLDPSLADGAKTTSKLGIDATVPPSPADGPSPIPPRSRVPEKAAEEARALLNRFNNEGWPRQ